jgi:hypothetical protein
MQNGFDFQDKEVMETGKYDITVFGICRQSNFKKTTP